MTTKRYGRAYITAGLTFALLFSGSLALGTGSAKAATRDDHNTQYGWNWTDIWNGNWNWNGDWDFGNGSGSNNGGNGAANSGNNWNSDDNNGSNSGTDWNSDGNNGSNSGSDSASTIADGIIAKGKTFMGVPYKFGSKTGNTKSFDCSSFTQYLFEQAGISIPRSSKEQSMSGTYVPRNELKPGDLVFFYSPVHHVALYIGNGKILHTYGKPGVTINDLNSGWWDEHYTTARRYINQ